MWLFKATKKEIMDFVIQSLTEEELSIFNAVEPGEKPYPIEKQLSVCIGSWKTRYNLNKSKELIKAEIKSFREYRNKDLDEAKCIFLMNIRNVLFKDELANRLIDWNRGRIERRRMKPYNTLFSY